MTRQKPRLSDHNPGHPREGKKPLLSTLADIHDEPERPPSPAIRILTVDDVEELHCYENALEELAKFAAESNVFLEPWMLFPALESFGRRKPVVFLLFFVDNRSDNQMRSKLCGFIPLERRACFHGLPFPSLMLWRYPHSFLATPLLRKGWTDAVVSAFFAWIQNQRGSALLLELSRISCAGDLHASFEHALRQCKLEMVDTRYERAMFRPRKNADAYFQEALSKKRRKEFKRLERRLSELGTLVFDKMGAGDDPGAWIGEFLQLEAAGWKGRKGTAFAVQEENRAFFLKIAAEAVRRGRLEMLALRLDGKAVAMKCNLLTKDGGFAFKIAYDEDFYHYSPGLLLELAQIRWLHADSNCQWMDSCADHDHFMINRLWLDRKLLRTVVVSTGHRFGNPAVRVVRFLKSILRGKRGYEFILPRASRKKQGVSNEPA